jgi:hypothetical protein
LFVIIMCPTNRMHPAQGIVHRIARMAQGRNRPIKRLLWVEVVALNFLCESLSNGPFARELSKHEDV